MRTPSDEQIERLPQWAQAYIKDLRRQRAIAISELQEFVDAHATGAVAVRLMTSDGESRGPTLRTVRFDAHMLELTHAGVKVDIVLADGEVRVSYEGTPYGTRAVLVPTSYQSMRLENWGPP